MLCCTINYDSHIGLAVSSPDNAAIRDLRFVDVGGLLDATQYPCFHFCDSILSITQRASRLAGLRAESIQTFCPLHFDDELESHQRCQPETSKLRFLVGQDCQEQVDQIHLVMLS